MENERLKKTNTVVNVADVEDIKDTYNSFMKNVYNQRQLSQLKLLPIHYMVNVELELVRFMILILLLQQQLPVESC